MNLQTIMNLEIDFFRNLVFQISNFSENMFRKISLKMHIFFKQFKIDLKLPKKNLNSSAFF